MYEYARCCTTLVTVKRTCLEPTFRDVFLRFITHEITDCIIIFADDESYIPDIQDKIDLYTFAKMNDYDGCYVFYIDLENRPLDVSVLDVVVPVLHLSKILYNKVFVYTDNIDLKNSMNDWHMYDFKKDKKYFASHKPCNCRSVMNTDIFYRDENGLYLAGQNISLKYPYLFMITNNYHGYFQVCNSNTIVKLNMDDIIANANNDVDIIREHIYHTYCDENTIFVDLENHYVMFENRGFDDIKLTNCFVKDDKFIESTNTVLSVLCNGVPKILKRYTRNLEIRQHAYIDFVAIEILRQLGIDVINAEVLAPINRSQFYKENMSISCMNPFLDVTDPCLLSDSFRESYEQECRIGFVTYDDVAKKVLIRERVDYMTNTFHMNRDLVEQREYMLFLADLFIGVADRMHNDSVLKNVITGEFRYASVYDCDFAFYPYDDFENIMDYIVTSDDDKLRYYFKIIYEKLKCINIADILGYVKDYETYKFIVQSLFYNRYVFDKTAKRLGLICDV